MKVKAKMRASTFCAAVLGLAAIPGFAATVPVLDAAVGFAVLGGATVTNTGPTALVGSLSVNANLGLYPGTAVSGLGAVTFTYGTVQAADSAAQQAQLSATKAYTALSLLPATGNLTGQDLGTLSGALAPGVYTFDTSAQLTGILQLDAQNTDGACWVFQIGSSLTTASNALVTLVHPKVTGNNGADIGVFWVVGSSATLGTGTTFAGNILASQSITLNTGAVMLNGRALALNGTVALDSNTISTISPDYNGGPGFSGGLVFASETSDTLIPIPEPSCFGALALFLTTLCGHGRRRTFAAGDFHNYWV